VNVDISNPGRQLFPDGTTKGDLADYYSRIAPAMLPYVAGRPVHMQRFPAGIEGEEINQKQVPDYFPDFVKRVRMERKRGGLLEQVVIDSADTLVYLADQACITPHVWLSRIDALDRPDRLIFDLDPPRRDLRLLRDGARAVRALLADIGLEPYLMATGSRGLHVVAALDRSGTFAESRDLANRIAHTLADEAPNRFTTEARKVRRGDRLYLDTGRNSYAQMAVAPYAVRARPNAPVACPLDWSELTRVEPDQITIHTIFRRLARRDDPWAGIGDHPASIGTARERLAQD
jgi:bifunctional non-homologous end joining protein LigD